MAPVPYQPPLVGREREANEIVNLLTTSPCRLLTIVGPGGVGKTRLAVRVALELQDRYTDGVHWVDLQAVRSGAGVPRAIADAVGVPGRESADPAEYLPEYLADRQALLLLDNFEHVIDRAPLVSDLLAAAPALQVITTSREALNLEEEWRYPIAGLPFPADDSAQDPESFASIRLFVDRARRVRPDFRLSDELQAVSRICRVTEGNPLALELAAAWTAALPCQEIAREIERSAGFLTSRARNPVARHSSMQAVFDQSWEMLSEEERSAFASLSVFRGGFDPEAATAVATGSLSVLSALVDKSLVHADPDGRYRLHELLHQYAADRLAARGDAARVRDRHCAYYAGFLHDRKSELTDGDQLRASREIRRELENVRAAWQWAVAERQTEAIAMSHRTLSLYFQFESRYREGAELMAQAAACLEDLPAGDAGLITRAEVMTGLGWFWIRLGRIEEAADLFRRSQELYSRLGTTPIPGFATDPLGGLSMLAHVRGDAAEAVRLGEEALRDAERRADRHNQAFICYLLAHACLTLGLEEEAFRYATRAVTTAEEVGNRWFLAYCLIKLGNVTRAAGRTDEARRHYQMSYEIRRAFEDAGGMAVALVHLGEVSLESGRPVEAREAYAKSLSLYGETGDRGGLATARCGLGRTAMAMGDLIAAGQHLEEAVRIAAAIEFVPLSLSVLTAAGDWLARVGEPEQAAATLAFVSHHPACTGALRERAGQLLDRLERQLSKEAFARAIRQGSESERRPLMEAALTRLAVLPDLAAHPRGPSEEPLPEPLTAREREVLALIADGLSNQQIAQRLFMTVGTIKWYCTQIYQKLQVASRTQAVARARELGLLR